MHRKDVSAVEKRRRTKDAGNDCTYAYVSCCLLHSFCARRLQAVVVKPNYLTHLSLYRCWALMGFPHSLLALKTSPTSNNPTTILMTSHRFPRRADRGGARYPESQTPRGIDASHSLKAGSWIHAWRSRVHHLSTVLSM